MHLMISIFLLLSSLSSLFSHLGGYFEGEISENWGHQASDTHWGALWKLPWSVEPISFVLRPLLFNLFLMAILVCRYFTTCSLLLQKRWPPTCVMWGDWTSLRSLITTTWESSSLTCSIGTAMSLTMSMTGSANRLWVPLTEILPPPRFWNHLIGPLDLMTAVAVLLSMLLFVIRS